MKTLIATIVLASSLSVSAQSLREICENAYYATGYTKLHQYRVIVDWARISDHALVELEEIIYSNFFEVLEEKELVAYKTKYILKEKKGLTSYQYEAALKKLDKITGNKAACVYDL